jgi:hypothetical protein
MLTKSTNDKIDQFEKSLVDNLKIVECPLIHKFTDGMYIREIFMPAGTFVTSMIHKTTHPFFILQGKVSVFSDNEGEVIYEAGHSGITTPNTRRVLFIHEDCRWVTCHCCKDGETVDEIEARIIEPHDNKLIEEETKKLLYQLHRYGLDGYNLQSNILEK